MTTPAPGIGREPVTHEERAQLLAWLDKVDPGELPLDVPPTIWHGLLAALDAADALREAAARWRRCHVDGPENIWDPDRDPQRGGYPNMPAECEARTCGVEHDCRNEYDASEDHLCAALARYDALAPPPGLPGGVA